METLNNVIKDILFDLGFANLYYSGLLKQNWNKIVGDIIASVTKPDRIDRDILYIKCVNPAWKQELYFFKEDIINKVNLFAGKKIIKDVKIFHSFYR